MGRRSSRSSRRSTTTRTYVSLFEITDGDKATVDWMKAHKTDWALTLDEHPEVTMSYPGYISDAVDFVL